MNALYIIVLSIVMLHLNDAAPTSRSSSSTTESINFKVRILSVHTGFYVQSKPDGLVSANAGDLIADRSTHFETQYNTRGVVTLRSIRATEEYLLLREIGQSATVAYPSEELEDVSSGSGDFPITQLPTLAETINHHNWEYIYDHSILSTVLRVRHTSGTYCYLAFEDDGSLVEDPCSEDLDLFKARVMLVALKE